jgi:hypothetical protein
VAIIEDRGCGVEGAATVTTYGEDGDETRSSVRALFFP